MMEKKSRTTLTLCEFLAARGGIREEAGELKALDAGLWHRAAPFRRKLVNEAGMTLDRARGLAEEAGYIRCHDGFGTTIADLLDAIDAELHGKPVYSIADDRRYDLDIEAERENMACEAVGPLVELYDRTYMTKKGRAGVSYYAKITVASSRKPVFHHVFNDDPVARERAVQAFLATHAAASSACPF